MPKLRTGAVVATLGLTVAILIALLLTTAIHSQDTGTAPASPLTATPTPDSLGTGLEVAWQAYQRPSISGIIQMDSIEYCSPPAGGKSTPNGQVLRFDLKPNARFTTGRGATVRAEVYGRFASSGNTPAHDWPDPVGSTRWYSIDFLIPANFATSLKDWLDITQWKGVSGGSPPLAIEVKGSHLRLGGSRSNDGAFRNGGDMGPIIFGEWTHLDVGIHFAASSRDGWVEVLRNSKTIIPRTHISTMDRIGNHLDPEYYKEGLYESSLWNQEHVIYFGPVTVRNRKP